MFGKALIGLAILTIFGSCFVYLLTLDKNPKVVIIDKKQPPKKLFFNRNSKRKRRIA